MNRFSAEFFVRSGCHLCDEAAPAVRRAVRWAGGVVEVIDIETNDRLVRDYGLRIPVLRVGGVDIAEGPMSAGRLWMALIRHRLGG